MIPLNGIGINPAANILEAGTGEKKRLWPTVIEGIFGSLPGVVSGLFGAKKDEQSAVESPAGEGKTNWFLIIGIVLFVMIIIFLIIKAHKS